MVDLYPSRVRSRPSLMERKDPVVYNMEKGLKSGPLDKEALESYDRNGYLLFENLFSEQEVEQMLEELQLIWDEGENVPRPEVVREPTSEEIRSVFAVHRDNRFFQRISRDPRIKDVASQILDSDVYIHQSRINFKPGFKGKEFYWHSDFETWHVEDGMPRMRAISFSVLLDDNLPYNGSLMLMPGSHRTFVSCVGKTPENHYTTSLRKQEHGVPDEKSLEQMSHRYGIHMPAGRKGSVLMFDCNTMHGSNSNITPYHRRNLFLVYNSVKNPLENPFSGGTPRPEFIASRESNLIRT